MFGGNGGVTEASLLVLAAGIADRFALETAAFVCLASEVETEDT